MERASRSLLSLSLSRKIFSQTNPSLPIKHLSILRPLSSKTSKTSSSTLNDQFPKKYDKDSFILEKFRQRKLKSSLKTTTRQDIKANSNAAELGSKNEGGLEGENQGQGSGPTKVVSSFEELGLKEEVAMAAGEMDVWFPSEIQCVGIPAILEGKSVVLSSDSGSGRTLAYLFPLVQLLRQDEALSSMKAKHPKAIVLCTTEEISDEGFRMAKLISDFARLKSASGTGSDKFSPEDVLDAPIGMLIGTPCDVAQQIEEGSIVTENIKYLVLDEADAMLDRGFGPEINKITSPLKNRQSESNDQGLQTVFVTSTMSKILGESEFVKRLEHDNGGKVAAMLLEMDQMEAFEIIESLDGLKKKMTEAIDSFISGS